MAKKKKPTGRGGPRPGAGRPRKWDKKLGERTQINLYAPVMLVAALDEECEKNGMSRSEQLIRMLSDRYGMPVD